MLVATCWRIRRSSVFSYSCLEYLELLTTERYSLGWPGSILSTHSPSWTKQLESSITAVLGNTTNTMLSSSTSLTELYWAVSWSSGVATLTADKTWNILQSSVKYFREKSVNYFSLALVRESVGMWDNQVHFMVVKLQSCSVKSIVFRSSVCRVPLDADQWVEQQHLQCQVTRHKNTGTMVLF